MQRETFITSRKTLKKVLLFLPRPPRPSHALSRVHGGHRRRLCPLAPGLQSFLLGLCSSLLPPSPFRLRLLLFYLFVLFFLFSFSFYNLRWGLAFSFPRPSAALWLLPSRVCVCFICHLREYHRNPRTKHACPVQHPLRSKERGRRHALILQCRLCSYCVLKKWMHVSSRYQEYWSLAFGGI